MIEYLGLGMIVTWMLSMLVFAVVCSPAMAHALAFDNEGHAMGAFARKAAWHRLGHVHHDLMAPHEALTLGRLDWLVEKFPMFIRDKLGKEIEVPGTFAVCREEDGDLIPITRNGKAVGPRYTTFQNWECFEFLEELLETNGAMIEACGALGVGEKVWALARMPEYMVLNGVDKICSYILITTSHDGSGAITVMPTNIRVVCQNTLSMALNRKDTKKFHMRHTASVRTKVAQCAEAIGLTREKFVVSAQLFGAMTTVNMSVEDAVDYFKHVLKVEKTDSGEWVEMTSRQKNQVADMVHSFVNESTNNIAGAKGTLWGAYNAVSFVIDHVNVANSTVPEKALVSAVQGTGNDRKVRAYERAMEICNEEGDVSDEMVEVQVEALA